MERTARPARGHDEDSQKYDQGWDCANSGSPLLSRWVTLESPKSVWWLQKSTLEFMILGPAATFPFKVFLFLDSTSSQWPEKVSVISYPEWERTLLCKSVWTLGPLMRCQPLRVSVSSSPTHPTSGERESEPPSLETNFVKIRKTSDGSPLYMVQLLFFFLTDLLIY